MDLQNVVSFVLSLNPAVVTLGLITLVLILHTTLLTRRIEKLTKGATGSSLEHVIGNLNARVEKLEAHGKTTELAFSNLDERLQSAIRSVVVRRFDPFENSGGQQSFAAAFLNESGDGVVISGIHARDTVRTYAKDVHGFTSERELSPDEAQTVADAKSALH